MGLRRALALAGAVLASVACPPSAAAQRGSYGVVEIYDEDDQPSSLSIESTGVEVTIRGRLARTRVTQVFANALDRQVEGIYRFRLPEGAAVRRMAMNVGEVMMEGAIGERAHARGVYEGIVADARDPALLEQDGRNLSVRIFPFPANGTKTIVLVYDQVVGAAGGRLRYRYEMPRAGAESVGRFRFTATRDGRRVHRVARAGYRPRGPIDVDLGRAGGASWAVTGERDGDAIFAASWTPRVRPRRHRIDTLVIAVDTSASMRGDPLARAVAVASAALDARGVSRVALVHGDLRSTSCTTRPVARTDRRLRRCLRGLAGDAGGASDVHDLLDRAARIAADSAGTTALLLLSDGAPTVGERDPDVLADAIAGFDLVYAAGFAEQAEEPLAALVAPAPVGRVWIDPAPREIAARVGGRVVSDVSARVVTGEVEDLAIAGPGEVLAGERVLVVGRLTSPRATVQVTATVGGESIAVNIDVDAPSAATDGELVAGPWARAQLAAMTAAGAPSEARVAFARRHEVLGDSMALLVLETVEDYERHGLPPPPAGAGAGGTVAVVPRRSARVPEVRIGNCGRTGDLDKNTIRRVVRLHHAAIRHCYTKALRREPWLGGTVVASWWIDAHGAPSDVEVADTSLGAPEVEACIAEEIATWQWPAVDRGGGWVQVRYPFELTTPDAKATYADLARELDALLDAGDTEAADAVVARVARRIRQTKAPPSRMLALLRSRAATTRYRDDFVAALRDRAARPHPPRDVAPRLFDALLVSDPDAIPEAVGDAIAETVSDPGVYLDALLDAGRADVAHVLAARWRAGTAFDDATLANALTADARRRAAFEATVVELVAASVGDPAAPVEIVDAGVAVARGTEVAAAVTTAVRVRCTALDVDRCRAWLAELAWDPGIAQHRRRLYRDHLAALDAARDETSEDSWITETAEALVVLGRERDAARRLSELFEHWPDAGWAAQLYGETRAALGL